MKYNMAYHQESKYEREKKGYTQSKSMLKEEKTKEIKI